jgi:hypothetical protein
MKDSEVHSQNICDMQLDILAAAVSAEVYHQRFLKLVNIGSCPYNTCEIEDSIFTGLTEGLSTISDSITKFVFKNYLTCV